MRKSVLTERKLISGEPWMWEGVALVATREGYVSRAEAVRVAITAWLRKHGVTKASIQVANNNNNER